MPELLGVRIDSYTKKEARAKVAYFLMDGKQHAVFTPNPEMLVYAHKHSEFKKVLNTGDLNVCDGKGIELFLRGVERTPGTDFVIDICELAAQKGLRVYLLGTGSTEVVDKAASNLESRISNLDVVGAHAGPIIDEKGEGDDESVIDDIIAKAPDILFVGFGHGKQEFWINKNLKDLPSVKVAIGIGGALDFIAGFNARHKKVRRAPKVMRSLGLEWLWRLVHEPYRWKRIFTATIIFPLLCIKNKYAKRHCEER